MELPLLAIFLFLSLMIVLMYGQILKYSFLDEKGNTTVVAGVPPDYFSETGQRWGNPLYRWDLMQERGFDMVDSTL